MTIQTILRQHGVTLTDRFGNKLYYEDNAYHVVSCNGKRVINYKDCVAAVMRFNIYHNNSLNGHPLEALLTVNNQTI